MTQVCSNYVTETTEDCFSNSTYPYLSLSIAGVRSTLLNKEIEPTGPQVCSTQSCTTFPESGGRVEQTFKVKTLPVKLRFLNWTLVTHIEPNRGWYKFSNCNKQELISEEVNALFHSIWSFNHAMGSHHRQVVILVPCYKLDCYVSSEFFLFWQKQSSFLSGTIAATQDWWLLIKKLFNYLKIVTYINVQFRSSNCW